MVIKWNMKDGLRVVLPLGWAYHIDIINNKRKWEEHMNIT